MRLMSLVLTCAAVAASPLAMAAQPNMEAALESLNAAKASLQKAMATPAIKERVATMGATPGVLTAAGFTQVIRNEVRRWAPKTGAAGGAGAAVATTAAVAPKP